MRTRIVVLILSVIAGAGLFLAGRATAPDGGGDYAAGHADGLREGRAVQATLGRDASERTAFDEGYRAGADDVFGGYDGGWGFTPYAIVLVKGSNGITYRIAGRTEMAAGVDYYCAPTATASAGDDRRQLAGAMLWLIRNRFAGSKRRLIRVSRS